MPTALSTRSTALSFGGKVSRAAVLGMSQETRDAWSLLLRRLSEGPMTLLGAPGPNRVLLDRARRAGALEGSLDDPAAPTHRVVIPFTGATPAQRRRWRERGHEVIDLTLTAIRRAHVMHGLLKSEGCRVVLGGHRGDPECVSITGSAHGETVVETIDEVVELPFEPRSGILFQTSISSQRARTIAEALRRRYRDSRLQILDTLSPAALARERALRSLAKETELVLIVADPADASGRALYETARWLGRPARLIGPEEEPDPVELEGYRRIGLSAAEFTPDSEIERIEHLLGRA